VRLSLSDSERTRELWPHAFALELVVTVGTTLDVELVMRNPGPGPFECAGALHSYFAIGNVAHVSVEGLEGREYLDKVLGYQRCRQAGPIRITGETDRVYLDTDAECRIADDEWHRTIRIGKRGSRTTVVWNPWVDRARQLADFGDDEYHEMVCVETVNAANDVVTVEPGGEHRLAATISSTPA
jgi:D-hexose-6-phosphate mutarotase